MFTDNSGLMHLMEAATALTQLVSAPPPSSAPSTASTSPAPLVSERRPLTHPISDDDDTMATSSKISLLRENHLQALRAASLAVMASNNDSSPRSTIDAPASANASVQPSPKDKEIFPMKLHALLADPNVRDVISWLPHGRSFVILRPDVFATRVLPMYFAPEGSNSLSRQTGNGQVKPHGSVHKYPSFTRKLNRWGFRQISRGADAGAFCHDLFRRDDPDACRDMVCQKSRKTSKDDCKSVSSASTMSMTSGGKRTSTAITVSTTGASGRSLPFKKRRGITTTSSYVMDIPANVEMKPNNSSLLTKKMSTSDAETVSNLSDGSMGSNKLTQPFDSALAASKSASPSAAQLAAETAAKEALTRHFHEQHRAFALASLMENSRRAMLARGLEVDSSVGSGQAVSSVNSIQRTFAVQPVMPQPRRESLGATTTSGVFAPTVTIMEPRPTNATEHTAAAEAAKSALYEAYKKALNSS